MTRPATRIQTRNRATILAAGLDIFSQYGFRGATLDQIAEASGLSKPNMLYYFPSKEAIHTTILKRVLETWLDPLRQMDASGDPMAEILAYMHRKLEMSRKFPRESRLFANEILQGAPHITDTLSGELRDLVNEKAAVLRGWQDAGHITSVEPHHLIFSIWALTQHYADFDVQVRAILGDVDPFDDAHTHLEAMLRGLLEIQPLAPDAETH